MNYNDDDDNRNVKMMNIGDIKISRAAFLTLIAGIILSTVIAITIPGVGPIIGLVLLLLWMLITYNINCVQVGHCNKWAWILTTFYLVYVGFAVMLLINKKDMFIAKFSPKNIKSKK